LFAAATPVDFVAFFPHVKPGSITADGAVLQLRTVGPCTVYCSAVVMGGVAPKWEQVRLGLQADNVTAGPSVWLSEDFRSATSVAVSLNGSAEIVSVPIWVQELSGSRNIDVYCVTQDVTSGAKQNDTATARTKQPLRFLSRTLPMWQCRYSATAVFKLRTPWQLTAPAMRACPCAGLTTFRTSLDPYALVASATKVFPVSLSVDPIADYTIVAFSTGSSADRGRMMLLYKDLDVRGLENVYAELNFTITRTP
jgi:hypothetical protein